MREKITRKKRPLEERLKIATVVFRDMEHVEGWSNISDGFHNPYMVRIRRTPPTHPQIITTTNMKSDHL